MSARSSACCPLAGRIASLSGRLLWDGPSMRSLALLSTLALLGSAALAATLAAQQPVRDYAFTDATSAACALRSWLPAVPVTTTSDRLMTDCAILMFNVAV